MPIKKSQIEFHVKEKKMRIKIQNMQQPVIKKMYSGPFTNISAQFTVSHRKTTDI